jgi:hypothetical protein
MVEASDYGLTPSPWTWMGPGSPAPTTGSEVSPESPPHALSPAPRKQDEGRKGMSRPLTGVRLVLSQVVDTRVATVLRNAAAVLPGSANASSVESAAAAVSIVNSVP